MWGEFLLAVLLGAAFLAGPGVAVTRGARLPWAFALAVAPGCSVALYSLIALGFSLTGVTLSGAVLLTVAVVAAVAAWGGLRALARRGVLGSGPKASRPSVLLGWELGLYVAVGMLATLLILIRPLDDPAMPTQAWDNVFHFGTVRAFLDSGDWSFLNVAQYKTSVDRPSTPSRVRSSTQQLGMCSWRCWRICSRCLWLWRPMPLTCCSRESSFRQECLLS